VMALAEARRAGGDEALVLNTRGRVVGGSASNLFLVSGETLLTPSPADGALPGITREAVIEIAAAEGIPVREEAPAPDELARAGEIFLTSSLRGLAPVVSVAEEAIGEGEPGAVFRRMEAAFRRLVAAECGGARGAGFMGRA
jgi:branched-chain amino acid aminotransferase